MRSKLFLVVVGLFSAVFLFVCIVNSVNSTRLTPAEQSTLIISSIQNNLVEERVMHPDQLNLEDIRVGDILVLIHMDGGQEKVLILQVPYFENGTCKFTTVTWKDGAPVDISIQGKSCADAGLVEYSVEGLTGWNPTNHIIESGDSPLTPEQLEGVISNLIQKPSNEFLQLQQRDA